MWNPNPIMLSFRPQRPTTRKKYRKLAGGQSPNIQCSAAGEPVDSGAGCARASHRKPREWGARAEGGHSCPACRASRGLVFTCGGRGDKTELNCLEGSTWLLALLLIDGHTGSVRLSQWAAFSCLGRLNPRSEHDALIWPRFVLGNDIFPVSAPSTASFVRSILRLKSRLTTVLQSGGL